MLAKQSPGVRGNVARTPIAADEALCGGIGSGRCSLVLEEPLERVLDRLGRPLTRIWSFKSRSLHVVFYRVVEEVRRFACAATVLGRRLKRWSRAWSPDSAGQAFSASHIFISDW